jgi:hypothetical protein
MIKVINVPADDKFQIITEHGRELAHQAAA